MKTVLVVDEERDVEALILIDTKPIDVNTRKGRIQVVPDTTT